MSDLYDRAIAGRLYSPAPTAEETTTSVTVTVYNKLPVKVFVYAITNSGTRSYQGYIAAGANANIPGDAGEHFVFTSATSGSFICAYTFPSSSGNYTIDNSVLSEPNNVGPIPQPTQAVPVPVNSPLVMVGCSTVIDVNGATNYITREQYWNLQGDSYSLTVGESRTVSYTIVAGRQVTSSTEDTVGASVGVDAHAGWGPVSAGISASLNAQSTTFQQVSVNEQTTTYVSDTVSNASQDDVIVLRWQMTDVINVYNSTYVPLSSVVSGLNPIVVQHYALGSLEEAFVRPALVARPPRPLIAAD